MAPLLSQYIAIKLTITGTAPSFVMSVLIQTIFFCCLIRKEVPYFNCRIYYGLLFRTFSTYDTTIQSKNTYKFKFAIINISYWQLTSEYPQTTSSSEYSYIHMSNTFFLLSNSKDQNVKQWSLGLKRETLKTQGPK